MKRDLMEILCCPMCKGDITITVVKETDGEIIQGNLNCQKCDINYPIEDGIPNMLPPELR